MYIPARLPALIPQFLFFCLALVYILAVLGVAFTPPWSMSDILGLIYAAFPEVLFLWWLRDWAIRAERPRNTRHLFESIFLAYPQPNRAARISRGIYYLYIICAICSPFLLIYRLNQPHFTNENILTMTLVAVAVSFVVHDYARSFDVNHT
jgi:hypothetical protein